MLHDLPEESPTDDALVRLELACALYEQGRLGKIRAAEFAEVDFFTFQRALGERQVPVYSEEQLTDDLQSLKELFPR
ncbi:hypothetical protein LBMAG56_30970 [Verrucomicrobiota bacterium]|nr:hypothetical protein LBMAG56_30970 [Verrucomicrobiota bacterium]